MEAISILASLWTRSSLMMNESVRTRRARCVFVGVWTRVLGRRGVGEMGRGRYEEEGTLENGTG